MESLGKWRNLILVIRDIGFTGGWVGAVLVLSIIGIWGKVLGWVGVGWVGIIGWRSVRFVRRGSFKMETRLSRSRRVRRWL